MSFARSLSSLNHAEEEPKKIEQENLHAIRNRSPDKLFVVQSVPFRMVSNQPNYCRRIPERRTREEKRVRKNK